MKVLVESSTRGTFWMVEYAGRVVMQTDTRYLLRYGFFGIFEAWVPKDGAFLRCREITKVNEDQILPIKTFIATYLIPAIDRAWANATMRTDIYRIVDEAEKEYLEQERQ